jgi:hypothetical protein
MLNLRRYWQEIRAIQSTLPEPTWLMSVENPRIVETPAAVAARLIYAKSHRVATQEEIDAQRASEDAAKRAAFHDELRKRGITVVALDHQRE